MTLSPGQEMSPSSVGLGQLLWAPGLDECDPEMWHLRFRGFSPGEGSEPVRDLRMLSELCRQWLRPDLHTKEEMVDRLVMEQFLICMPPCLQALVVENRVQSCQELEALLSGVQQPTHWSVFVNSEGQKVLVQTSDVDTKDAETSDPGISWDKQESEEHLQRTGISPQPQSSAQVEGRLWGQGQDILPETLSGEDLQGLRGSQHWEEDTAGGSAPASRESPLPQGPAAPGKPPQHTASITKVPAGPPATHVPEGEQSAACGPSSAGSSGRSPGKRLDIIPRSLTCPRRGQEHQDAGELSGHQVEAAVAGADAIQEAPARVPGSAEAAQRPPFCCGACGKAFLYQSQLILHQRSHTGERPFRCDECGKGFLQGSDLRVHTRVHTGERPHQCRVCGRTFAHLSSLRSHQRVHTRERPHACKHCSRRFSHRGNLNVHLRIHTQAKPYTCASCGRAFRQLGTWRRHLKLHAREAAP